MTNYVAEKGYLCYDGILRIFQNKIERNIDLTGCCSKDKMPGYREYFVLKSAQMWPCVCFSFIYLFWFVFKNADSCLLGLL